MTYGDIFRDGGKIMRWREVHPTHSNAKICLILHDNFEAVRDSMYASIRPIYFMMILNGIMAVI